MKKDKIQSESEDEVAKPLHGRISRLSMSAKSQDESLDHKIRRDVRVSSNSTLNCEMQSIRTSSSASEAASTGERKKLRPSRSSLVASTIHSQPNSSNAQIGVRITYNYRKSIQ